MTAFVEVGVDKLLYHERKSLAVRILLVDFAQNLHVVVQPRVIESDTCIDDGRLRVSVDPSQGTGVVVQALLPQHAFRHLLPIAFPKDDTSLIVIHIEALPHDLQQEAVAKIRILAAADGAFVH